MNSPSTPRTRPLTQAEVDVPRLIAKGNANKQIAAQLSITEETVKGRVKNILSKLGANDRTHAAMIGMNEGLSSPARRGPKEGKGTARFSAS